MAHASNGGCLQGGYRFKASHGVDATTDVLAKKQAQ